MGASLWEDRLAEVWASPGEAGSGVVIGTDGVLTARHVIAGAIGDEARRLARIVCPGRSVAAWAPMHVVWEDARWDLALLQLDRTKPGSECWEAPRSLPSDVMLADLGTRALKDCETVGFPQSAEQRRAHDGRPADVIVRQSEQALGTVLPSGQGKTPVDPDRDLPLKWVPFDVDRTTADTQADWSGMSGAGVVLRDGRLVGIVTTADAARDHRRLYVVTLADVLSASPELAAGFAEVTGSPPVLETLNAPEFKRVCQEGSLLPCGMPPRVCEVTELQALGVKPADLPGEPTYLNYVPRDADTDLHGAIEELRRQTGSGERGRMLLVVGASAAGKSRSTAHAIHKLLPEHRLIRPKHGMLADVCGLPLHEVRPAVVWLDEMQDYAHPALRDTLESLLSAGLILVGTIRQLELKELSPTGEIRNPAGEALADSRLVRRLDWNVTWNPEERERLTQHVSHPGLLEAVAKGTSPGAYVVAGPRLLAQLNEAREDENDFPCHYALVRTVLDWYRTGIGLPIPLSTAKSLLEVALPDDAPAEPDEIDEALRWATTRPAIGSGRTRQTLLTQNTLQELAVHDYVLDDAQRHAKDRVPDPVWQASLQAAKRRITAEPDRLWRVGVSAFEQGMLEVALTAMQTLATDGRMPEAMFNVGVLLGQLDRSEEAIAVYDELVGRFGEATEPALREQTAEALLNKGITLGQLDRSEEEIAVYDELVGRFGEATEPALREQTAKALLSKGITLGQLDRSEEAIAVYDELVGRFGEATEPALRERTAKALLNKGVALGQLDRSEEAIAVYDELVGRFGEATEPALREQTAKALLNKGVALGQLDRSEEEIAVYDELVGRFGEATEPALREQTAKALLNKGITLGQLDRSEEEIAVYDELVGRFGEATEPALREQTVKALLNKGIKLGQLDRSEEEIAVYDELVGRFGEATEPALREQTVKALLNKGITLGQLDRSEEEIAVYDELVGRFGEATEPALRERTAEALLNKGVALGQLDRSEEAIAVYDELVGRFGEATEPALRERTAEALLNKGITLGQLDRENEAIRVFSDLLARFAGAPEEAIADLVDSVKAALESPGIVPEADEQERSSPSA